MTVPVMTSVPHWAFDVVVTLVGLTDPFVDVLLIGEPSGLVLVDTTVAGQPCLEQSRFTHLETSWMLYLNLVS